VHSGQVLAEIETPELDQQVQQAQSDLATAQANQQIAQITAERWKKLLTKNAVSKQEVDQATSDFSARQSALSSAEANVRRLQQLQGFEKIYAPFDGVITARNCDIGSLIQAGDSNSPRAVRDGRVQLVPVQVGHDYGAKVEITSGLTPQDQVILNPSDSLAQGERVQVEKGDAE
jgi:multidrug efflux pump subunit AcrA (membrane-fusion protein)